MSLTDGRDTAASTPPARRSRTPWGVAPQQLSRKPNGGSKRSTQQESSDLFDRLLER